MAEGSPIESAVAGGAALTAHRPRRLATLLPITVWLRRYRWDRDLLRDGAAGLALAALLIPESIGYAGVAGVPPQAGLYAAMAAVVAYAVTGGSSVLVVGPASAIAALTATLIIELPGSVSPWVVAAGLSLVSGALLVLAGVLRLGWVVNFISRPVLHAFVAGLSISIIVGQLDGLLGVEVEGGTSPLVRLVRTLGELGAAHLLPVAIGVGSLVVLLVFERLVERVPAAVVVVAAGIALAAAFDLGEHGVALVGAIPQGLPELGVPELTGIRWWELVGGGLALVLVGFSEGYAASASVATSQGEEIDADQELIGSGVANIASGLVGGMPVGGSLSKSAASLAAGARTQMTNLVAGLLVLATLLFLAPLFEQLPEPVLAAVIIVAVVRSADPRPVIRMRQVNWPDFAAATVTFVLVLTWETLPALGVGVALSLGFVVRRASFPDIVELRQDRDGRLRHATDLSTPLHEVPGVAVLRLEAPLLYANADRLVIAARRLLARRPDATLLVIDAEMISDLDGTGAEALERLDDDLAERGIELRIALLHRRARAQLDRSQLRERFEARLDPSLRVAVHRGEAPRS